MLRFIAHQVRHRRSRSFLLAMGILVAAVSFTLLASQATTSALEVRGTIAKNWRPAYDILVRPRGASTGLERTEGLVRANYLSGIFGGITWRQWRLILSTPGVEVAAPIENIGYILPFERVAIPITQYLSHDPYQVYRVREARIADNGVSHYPGPDTYVYYTRAHRFIDQAGDPYEVVPGRAAIPVCNGFNYGGSLAPQSPFDLHFQSRLYCFSSRSPNLAKRENGAVLGGVVGTATLVYFPLLLAAVDPAQEGRLLNLGHAVISGRALNEGDGPEVVTGVGANGSAVREAPVIASSTISLDETLLATVEPLQLPPGIDLQGKLASPKARSFLERLPAQKVGVQRIRLQDIFERMVAGASEKGGLSTFESYRTVSPVRYRVLSGGRVAPVSVRNPESDWLSSFFATFLSPPTENEDVQFRSITARSARATIVGGVDSKPRLRVVGRFDPSRLSGFSPLSGVPLETYYPPVVQPADLATRRALGGHPLLPTMNVGGYVSQPPMLLTTLRAASLFTDPSYFPGANPSAPISVIRVRVAGVAGPDAVSRERVRRVTEAIHDETGLAVDITAGSSPQSVLVELPAGKFGQPPLLVREGWVKKGVAVVILRALDRKSLAMFLLVLLVTGLFLSNAALASVRSRRVEIGTLLALGWPRRAIFTAVIGEAALIGLGAGVIGAVFGAALATALRLRIPVGWTLLEAPVALGLASLAGLLPAWWASRAVPLDAVRSTAKEGSRPRKARTMLGLAFANVRRVRSRALVAVGGVFIGVAAASFLLAVQFAFRGAVVGTALGAFVSIQVRTVDYLSVGLVVCLAALSVADILVLNLRERAAEVVTLRAAGWRGTDLRRLVETEGAIIGLVGGIPGAAVGVGLTALVGGRPLALLSAGIVAASGAIALVLLASLIPALRTSRLTPVAILGEE